jgi:hypothetical protein
MRPGIAFTRLHPTDEHFMTTQRGINPVFSAIAGYNFYLSRFFHFFISTSVLLGEHNYDVHTSLSELRISAGLGFNVNTFKCK